jgi:hypothetical protein
MFSIAGSKRPKRMFLCTLSHKSRNTLKANRAQPSPHVYRVLRLTVREKKLNSEVSHRALSVRGL